MDDERYEDDGGRSVWQRARALIGVLALFAIGFVVYAAEQDVAAARDADASAIQIVQVWTPNLFYMMTVIGVTIALYIITRVAEE